jgi:hypothetical protein
MCVKVVSSTHSPTHADLPQYSQLHTQGTCAQVQQGATKHSLLQPILLQYSQIHIQGTSPQIEQDSAVIDNVTGANKSNSLLIPKEDLLEPPRWLPAKPYSSPLA